MRKLPVLLPAVGASAAFAAALDAQVGAGAVEWLIDLCLTDPETPMAAPTMPMKHGAHVPLYAGIGCALASAAAFAAWWQSDGARTAPSRDGELALIAALSVMANATRGCGAAAVRTAHDIVAPRPLGTEEADIALDYFTPDSLLDDIDLFAGLTGRADRAMVICGAIEFARSLPGHAELDDLLIAIAGAMGMSGDEIDAHWSERMGTPCVEPTLRDRAEHLRAAMDRLGGMAAEAARRYVSAPSPARAVRTA